MPLEDDIKEQYYKRDKYLRENFDRSLSYQDALFDRWERAEKLNFGTGSSIYNSALIFGKVNVLDNTWIGPYVILDGSGGDISIGRYCSISAGTHLYTHDSVQWALSGGKKTAAKGAITIGSNTYIGAQVVIKHNIKIGKFCVVGAHSFINKDIPDYSIIAGVPGKKIGTVHIDENGDIELDYGSDAQ